MALTILEGFGKGLFQGLSAAYIGAQPVQLLDAGGNRLTRDILAVAPVITQMPTILPAIPVIGQSITLALGSATGTPTAEVVWDFTLDGVSIKNRLDAGEMTMELTSPGVYVLSVGWSNSAGTVQAGTRTFTLVAAPVTTINYDTQTLCYFDASTAYAGTAADVTSITTRGIGGYVLTRTGSGAAIQHSNAGFVFGDGVYLQSQTLANQPTTDGLFAVLDVTLASYGSNIAQLIDGTGGHVKIRNSAGTLQMTGSDDTAVNLSLGAADYGRRVVLAAQIDDILDLLSGFDASGNLVSTPHAGLTDPAPNRIACGRYLLGTIHRLALVGRAEGQAWPTTMREVVEDFRRGA